MRVDVLCIALIVLLAFPAQAVEETPRPSKFATMRTLGVWTFAGLSVTNALVAGLSMLAASSAPQPSPLVPLFIPIAGPWIAMANVRVQTPVGITFLAADGLAQLASATLMVVAIVLEQGELSKSAWRLAPAPGGVTLTARW